MAFATMPVPAGTAETDKADMVLKRLASLETARSGWEAAWQDAALNFRPRKETFSGPLGGRPNDEHIYASTPTHALEMLASGLGGLLTNPATKWFDMRARGGNQQGNQPTPDVVAWLEACRDAILTLCNADDTGFQSAMSEVYLDYCLFGTACLFVEPDDDSIVRFTARPLSEVYLAEDAHGIVDTVFRKYRLTARQIMQLWPDTCSQAVKDALKDKPEQEFEMVQAVFPRADRDPLAKLMTAKDFPYACIYMETASREILEESGYPEMPFMCPRWSKAAGETYGWGPAMTALPDARLMHLATRDYISAAQKKTDPPILVPDDGFVGRVDTRPGGITYVRPTGGNGDKIELLPNGSDLAASLQFIQYLDSVLREMFLANQLDDSKSPAMTATESLIKQNEKLKILTPILGRMQSELLTPLIHRLFNILMRAKQLPQNMPQGMSFQSARVAYTGPLARLQQQQDGQALQQTVAQLSALIGQTDPLGIVPIFNGEPIARGVAESNGLPASWLHTEQEVAATKQQQAQQQQAAALDQSIQSAANTAKTAGAAKVTPDTALGQVAQQAGLVNQAAFPFSQQGA